jgi:hypothetical protein
MGYTCDSQCVDEGSTSSNRSLNCFLAGNLGHGDMENRLTATKVDSLAATHSVTSVSCGAFHAAVIATEVAESVSASSSDVHVDMLPGGEDRDESEMFNADIDSSFNSNRVASSAGKRIVLMTW